MLVNDNEMFIGFLLLAKHEKMQILLISMFQTFNDKTCSSILLQCTNMLFWVALN